MELQSWLKQSGASGLDDLELADFPLTGRGVRAKRAFEKGEKILTIPSGLLWTVEHAHADPLLGPALRAARPALSVEDTLATYLLFVRSRESGYEGQRSHVEALPRTYSSSIFFSDGELEVCAGSSLYTITKQLNRSISEDYKGLVVGLFMRHRDLFPLDKFTLEDVCVHLLYLPVIDVEIQAADICSSVHSSTNGPCAPSGVEQWTSNCPMASPSVFWRPSRTC